MNILVCVKQVVDTSQMKVDPDTGRLERNHANSIMNPLDRHALEAAFRLRDEVGGKVSVLTMGPPQAKAILRDAVALGADALYLASDRAFGGADTLATSYTLSTVIRHIGPFDLILCGQESIDSNTAQVGPEIAGMLGIADVSAALDIKPSGNGTLLVTRQMGDGVDVVELKLPAVVTATASLFKVRYPSIKGLLKKDDVEIQVFSSKDLPFDETRIGLKGSPTQVKGVRTIVVAKKENLRVEDVTAEEGAETLCDVLKKIEAI